MGNVYVKRWTNEVKKWLRRETFGLENSNIVGTFPRRCQKSRTQKFELVTDVAVPFFRPPCGSSWLGQKRLFINIFFPSYLFNNECDEISLFSSPPKWASGNIHLFSFLHTVITLENGGGKKIQQKSNRYLCAKFRNFHIKHISGYRPPWDLPEYMI